MITRRRFLGYTAGVMAASILPRFAFGRSKPAFRLYDTHAHFYTNEPDKYPFNASTARYGAEKLIAKAMAHPKTPEIIFKGWDESGVAKGVAVQYGSAYLYDNSYIIDISKKYPDRITPVAILPVAPETPAKMEKMTREDKISGIRFRGFPADGTAIHDFLNNDSREIWETANRLGIVIVLMPHSRNIIYRRAVLKRIGELAVTYSNVTIILDHMGFPQPESGPIFGFYPELLEFAKLDNIYYKYTNLLIGLLRKGNVPIESFVAFAANTFGTDKIIWGSDYGNTEGTMSDLVNIAVESAGLLSKKQQKEMFFDTADRIHVPGGRGPKKKQAGA